MFYIALKMLMGDRAKYFGIIIGLSFASFIITQQAAIFIGLMTRTYGFITDTSQPSIWVMEEKVQFIDDIRPLKATQLYRVRSVEGVKWAVPFYKGLIKARLSSGIVQTCNVIGIDDATLIGGPPKIISGSIINLRDADAIIVNDVGAKTKLAHPDGTPLAVGDVIEINDHRAIVAGICETSRTFQSQPVIYTTFSRATAWAPPERKLLSFILADVERGYTIKEVCDRIETTIGLAAYSADEFKQLTVDYYMKNTGIPINFGVAVLLGFIIGVVISGQTFYNFTLDNIRYLGTFKAMGADDPLLTKMTFLQAVVVGFIGWGIGSGAAAAFGYYSINTELSFRIPLELFVVSGLSMFFICLLAAYLSLLKVYRLDPAIVFRS